MDKSQSRSISGNDESLNRYFGEISNIPLLTTEEEVDLAGKIRRGNKRALKKLVQSNLRFVVRIALEYKNQGLPLEDLVNEGNLGLIKAANRFDETKGFKFISYAVWWIRQSILQALADHARVIRLPLNRVSTLSRVGRTHDSLEQTFEREPTVEEIADSLDLSTNDLTWISNFPGKQLSLDAPISDIDAGTLLEKTKDEELDSPDQPVSDEALKNDIKIALKSLTKKEAEVLRLYFGIDEDQQATFEEIGKKLHLTRERIRQIKERAIIRLRHQSRSKALRQYLG